MPRRARGTRTCVRFPNRSAWPRRRVADDTRLTTHEGTPDLGLSRIFNDFSTFTQSSQTHGVYFPRHQKHYETQSFSEKNPTGRRSSTSPWESHPSSRRLATYGWGPFWAVESTLDLNFFKSNPKSRRLHNSTSGTFSDKVIFLDSAYVDSLPTRKVHSGQWNTPSTLTSSNRTQTRGGYTTRRRERFETKSHFWTRRTSTRYLRGRPILGGGTHPRLISVFLRSTEAQNAYFTEKVKKIQLFTNFMSNRFTFTSNLFIKIQVFLRSTEAQNDLFTEIVKKNSTFHKFHVKSLYIYCRSLRQNSSFHV